MVSFILFIFSSYGGNHEEKTVSIYLLKNVKNKKNHNLFT